MKSPEKILIVAPDNLGDAVMASAVLAPLKQTLPNAVVGLWVKEYTAGLFSGHPNVDRLYAADPFWDRAPGRPAGRCGPFLSIVRAMRAERYDVAIVLNTEWRRALAIRCAGVADRVGYDRRHSRWLLTRAVPMPEIVQHFVDDHRVLLEKGAGVRVPMAAYVTELFVSSEDKAQAEHWCRDHALSPKKYWVAHPFSGDARKNWPIAKWLELIGKTRDSWPDQTCVALLGPSEETKLLPAELAMLRMQATLLSSPPLGMLKGILRDASLTVDGDSGPGHIAAALQTPVISLFGPTNPLRSRPLGVGLARIVSSRNVADIAVDHVWNAMDDFHPGV